MRATVLSALQGQFETAWQLAAYHLNDVSTEECLWRPAAVGLHVQQDETGLWQADIPQRESYDIGPPSIAWVSWHMIFSWSMAIDHNFGEGGLTHQDVDWPGSAQAVRARLQGLREVWVAIHARLLLEPALAEQPSIWPFQDRTLADVAAWMNVELTKNAAEIGYARFLYATRDRGRA